MRAPDLQELRPGDFIKVRGSSNPLHDGGKAVVVAVHREQSPPWRVVALDIRYSARGQAIRVEIADSGELARWETPWAPAHTVEDEPARREFISPGAAEVAAPTSRRGLVVGGLVVLAVLGALGTWGHQRTEPNPVVVQRALQEAVRGTGTSTGTPTGTAAVPVAGDQVP